MGAKVISVANQKGGVGKTTSALNIALYISEFGQKTLLIDLDPQANATSGIGVDTQQIHHSIYDVISNDEHINDCIYPTPFEQLHLVPSCSNLAGADVELSTTVSRETILKQRLTPILDQYDYIIIDCPPSLSLLTLNAFSFTHQLVVPVQCEYFALEGLAKLLNTIQLIKERLNPTLSILGIVLTMFDRRTSLNRQVVNDARHHFKKLIFDTVIPRNIRLAEAPSFGLPIALYAPKSSGSIAYYHLTKEIIERAKTNKSTG
jgi:chromosome partitioning protein